MPSLKETLRQLQQTRDRQAAQRETEREKEAAARQREEEWQKKWEEDYPKAEADLRRAVAALDPLFRLLEEAGIKVEPVAIGKRFTLPQVGIRKGFTTWFPYGFNATFDSGPDDAGNYHDYTGYLSALWHITFNENDSSYGKKDIHIQLSTVTKNSLLRERLRRYNSDLILKASSFSTVFHISQVNEVKDELEQFLARQIRELYQK